MDLDTLEAPSSHRSEAPQDQVAETSAKPVQDSTTPVKKQEAVMTTQERLPCGRLVEVIHVDAVFPPELHDRQAALPSKDYAKCKRETFTAIQDLQSWVNISPAVREKTWALNHHLASRVVTLPLIKGINRLIEVCFYGNCCIP